MIIKLTLTGVSVFKKTLTQSIENTHLIHTFLKIDYYIFNKKGGNYG